MADEIVVSLAPHLAETIHKMPEIEQNVQSLANAIAFEARAAAPVETGSYRSQIRVEKTKKSNSGIWRVFSASKKSGWIEFGIPSQKRDGMFILRNAAVRVGATFVKSKR